MSHRHRCPKQGQVLRAIVHHQPIEQHQVGSRKSLVRRAQTSTGTAELAHRAPRRPLPGQNDQLDDRAKPRISADPRASTIERGSGNLCSVARPSIARRLRDHCAALSAAVLVSAVGLTGCTSVSCQTYAAAALRVTVVNAAGKRVCNASANERCSTTTPTCPRAPRRALRVPR